MTTPHSPLLNRVDAAAYIGLAVGTLDRWRTEGRSPDFVKIGGAVRYRLTVLDEFLDAHTVAQTGTST